MIVVFLHVFTLVYAYKAHSSYASMSDEQSVRLTQVSASSPSPMTPISKEQQTDISTRAKYIRNLIEKNKHWRGGHSPIPSRVISMETIKTVNQLISIEDSAALMVLLQDDAADIRSTAATLLTCVNPNARSEVIKLMVAGMTKKQESRFEDALLTMGFQQVRTLCE